MRRKFAVAVFLILLVAGVWAARFALPRLNIDLGVKQSTIEAVKKFTGSSTLTSRETQSTPQSAESLQRIETTPGINTGAAGQPNASQASEQTERPGVRLTTARIARDGPSVFAGTAPPNAGVTVLDGTTAIATAKANDNGDWSVVTEHEFATTDPAINVRETEAKDVVAETSVKPAKLPAAEASPSTRLMKEFEGVVASAREEAKHRDGVAKDISDKEAAGQANVGTQSPVESPSTPVPMTFVYNESELTAEGKRATALLLEYLKLKNYAAVTLSGHADERGSADYNMELSRQRLDAVMRVLREGGYQGRLSLLPKGSTEPFTAVDRSRFPKEELMQLDRRVELRVAQ